MYGSSAYGRVAYGAKPASDAVTTFPEPAASGGKILMMGVSTSGASVPPPEDSFGIWETGVWDEDIWDGVWE